MERALVSERNWAGNVTFGAARWHSPTAVDEVMAVVGRADRVRVVGSRHSFNDIADTDGDVVSLQHMDRALAIDPDARTVTVEGGIRYGQLARYLHERGWALANLASLPHITVAGAVATATHGSGAANGNLATAVVGMDLVTTGTDRVELVRDVDPDLFAALVVGLGAFGIVTSLTLRIEPTFAVEQRVYENLPVVTAVEQLGAIMATGYSTSLFTRWQGDTIGQAWCKRRVEPDAADLQALIGDDDSFFGAVPATRAFHPIEALDASACTEQFGRVGPWHERLPHFRPDAMPNNGDELQSELFVAAEDGGAAIEALASLGPALNPVLQVSEVRAVAADELWLSPCYRRASVAFHFTWVSSWGAVRPVLAQVEAALEPFAPRPHWGKLTTLTTATIRERYERLPEFAALAAEWDPRRRFRNRFLDELLDGAPS